jgi:hypothetical protein
VTEVVEHQGRQRRTARHASKHVPRVAHREHRATGRLDLDLLDRIAGDTVGTLDEAACQLSQLTHTCLLHAARVDEPARGVENHGRHDVRGAVDESPGDHHGHNSRVPLPRISWMVTVGVCLIAALLLLVSGYSGYAAVLVAIGAAAAVNLL